MPIKIKVIIADDQTIFRSGLKELLTKEEEFEVVGEAANGRQCQLLTKREREISALVSRGFKNKEIADKLSVSEQTVKNHLHNIFDKLGIRDRLGLAVYMIYHNLQLPASEEL